jgi:F0F1-type ATP synthase membrane subunit c/vacuolar-type H+-ATPase subunit K
MRKSSLTAMLTSLALLTSGVAVAGCGGKGTSSTATQTTTPTTETTTSGHKPKNPKAAY